MRMRESPPRRPLVQCGCKRTDHGLVFGDGQLLKLRYNTSYNNELVDAASSSIHPNKLLFPTF